jgi:hypothetical protein
MDNIFSFWSGLSEEKARIHPRDKKVFARLNPSFEHPYFAEPFRGRLQTAPVVLLFLSPGLHERDLCAQHKSPRITLDKAKGIAICRRNASTKQLEFGALKSSNSLA